MAIAAVLRSKVDVTHVLPANYAEPSRQSVQGFGVKCYARVIRIVWLYSQFCQLDLTRKLILEHPTLKFDVL